MPKLDKNIGNIKIGLYIEGVERVTKSINKVKDTVEKATKKVKDLDESLQLKFSRKFMDITDRVKKRFKDIDDVVNDANKRLSFLPKTGIVKFFDKIIDKVKEISKQKIVLKEVGGVFGLMRLKLEELWTFLGVTFGTSTKQRVLGIFAVFRRLTTIFSVLTVSSILFGSIWRHNIGNIQGLFHEFIGRIMNLLAEFDRKLRNILIKFEPFFSFIFESFFKLLEDVLGGFIDAFVFLSKVLVVIFKFLKIVFGFLSNVWRYLKSILGFLSEIFIFLKPFKVFFEVAGKFIDKLGGIGRILGGIIGSLLVITFLVDSVAGIIEFLVGSSVIAGLMKLFSVLKWIGAAILGFLGGLSGWVIAIILSILAILTGILFYKFNPKFREWVDGLVAKFKEKWKAMIEKIREWWDNVVNSLKEKWDNFVESIKGVWESIVNFIKEKFGGIIDWIDEKISAFTNKFKEIKEKVTEKFTLKGMFSGIKDFFTRAFSFKRPELPVGGETNISKNVVYSPNISVYTSGINESKAYMLGESFIKGFYDYISLG